MTAIKWSYHYTPSGRTSPEPLLKLHELFMASDVDHLSRVILQKLQFRDVHQWYTKISPAHQKTFKWLFQPQNGPVTWVSFSDWLQSDKNFLFWITGKPGAGKSTLMRHIAYAPQTHATLRNWAAIQGFSLMINSFFFWNSGSDIQMSYEGLLRTLLYQLFDSAPDMIPVVLPDRMEAGILFGE